MSLAKNAKELTGYLRTIREKLHRTDKWNPKTSAHLNVREAHALMSIGDGGMTMSSLAKRLQLSVSSVTAIVDKLEQKNFVARWRLVKDRRSVEVRLTAAGRKFHDLVAQAQLRVSESFLAALSNSEQTTLLKLFRKITANIK